MSIFKNIVSFFRRKKVWDNFSHFASTFGAPSEYVWHQDHVFLIFLLHSISIQGRYKVGGMVNILLVAVIFHVWSL